MKTFLLLFATAFLFVASAAESYDVTLFYPSYVGDVELRPGDYKVLVDDTHVVIKRGRKSVEADVKIESIGEKAKKTSVRYDNGDGKYRISEIRLAGSGSKLVFN
jgi:hypothetical protein